MALQNPTFHKLRLLAGITCAVALSGCATITGGSKEAITINSAPSGALVKVDGEMHYTTPTSIELPRGRDHYLVITKHGYEPADIKLTRSFRALPTIGGNILWLIPGVIVDGFTGGMWKFDRNHIDVTLIPKKPSGTNHD